MKKREEGSILSQLFDKVVVKRIKRTLKETNQDLIESADRIEQLERFRPYDRDSDRIDSSGY